MAAASSTVSVRYLTFRVDAQLYALPAEQVTEVIRVPAMARVPQAPPALLGIANLRGAVLPVAGLRELLDKQTIANPATARAIVLDIGAPVAIIVDEVATLATAPATQAMTEQQELSAAGAEKLLGSFAVGADKNVAKILDIKALLQTAFARREQARMLQRDAHSVQPAACRDAGSEQTEMLVTFEVGGQEFALPLNVVQEILPAPSFITAVARADTVVLGVASVRDTLLPLFSLRTLLGFAATHGASERDKVVVMKVGQGQIGLVADRARAIIAADSQRIDPIPPLLAARTGGESRIKSVYRGEGGQRLISILSPEQLFREDIMQRLTEPLRSEHADHSTATSGAELVFLVFRLGDDEFGLPIDTVVEVAQVPERITRIPRTPKFLEGVVNLRGDVLPVVDQRRRFEMPKCEQLEGRRLVVIRTERHRAGLIVDSVSDVLRIRAADVEPAPELTDAISRLVRGVVNLAADSRIVLVLDPAELLTRAEQGQLDTFNAARSKADA